MRTMIITHRNNLSKEVAPGNGTFTTELLSRMDKRVSLSYMPYTNVATALLDSYRIRFTGMAKSVDIIHDIDGGSLISLSREMSKKFIFTMHSLSSFMTKDILLIQKGDHSISEDIWIKLGQYSTQYKMERAAAIIAVSSNVKQLMIDFADVDRDKIFVVNHGVTPEYKPMGLSHDKFVIGTLSGMSPNKDPRFLINAFIAFNNMLGKKEQGNVELQLHGKPGTKHLMQEIMSIAKDHSNIKMMGPVKQENKVRMYNSFDVFAFPSFAETFGIPIIEAQACGLPVIINGNGIVPGEVSKHCMRAYTDEEMADMFYNLYKKGYDKTAMKESASYAQGFTWDKAAEETMKVYEKVISGG